MCVGQWADVSESASGTQRGHTALVLPHRRSLRLPLTSTACRGAAGFEPATVGVGGIGNASCAPQVHCRCTAGAARDG